MCYSALIRLRGVAAVSRALVATRQLRCCPFSEDGRLKNPEQVSTSFWSKQIRELVWKRDLLKLIDEYVGLQQELVTARLYSNRQLLRIAKDYYRKIRAS